jgi:hypothetical protein
MGMTDMLLIIFGFAEFVLRLVLVVILAAVFAVLVLSIVGWVIFLAETPTLDVPDLLTPVLWTMIRE